MTGAGHWLLPGIYRSAGVLDCMTDLVVKRGTQSTSASISHLFKPQAGIFSLYTFIIKRSNINCLPGFAGTGITGICLRFLFNTDPGYIEVIGSNKISDIHNSQAIRREICPGISTNSLSVRQGYIIVFL